MHRRQLIRSLAAGLLLPPAAMTTLAREAEEGTPVAMPRHHGLPRPVALGDGIELIDYRVYPSTDVPRIIGEIVNTGDEMVDSPVVSVIFPDLGTDGLAYAPPFLPVMRPGESNLIFGVLPAGIDTGEKLAAAEFGLCAPVGPGEHSERLRGVDLRVTVETDSYYWSDSLNVIGVVQNDGTETVALAGVNGLVRDQHGRYVGVCAEHVIGDLAPGATHDYLLWAWTANTSQADPYALLNGSTDYSVDVVAGIAKPLLLPGCPAILPWNDGGD